MAPSAGFPATWQWHSLNSKQRVYLAKWQRKAASTSMRTTGGKLVLF
jgi:hypothetical protein